MSCSPGRWPSTLVPVLLPVVLFAVGCGGSGDTEGAAADTGSATAQEQSPAPGGDLTPAELENGIGPITSVDISEGTIDGALADEGAAIFQLKCSACHKMDDRYVGPPLGSVTETRSPAYVMNMILNPAEMIERHPEARKMLAQYYTPMAFQNVTEEDARALLEYLRQQAQVETTP